MRGGVRAWLRAGLMTVGLAGGADRASAQEPELVTDRPDFTESSEVVGRGLIQFEAGFSYESDERVGRISVPGSLGRIGVFPRVELRIGTDGMVTFDGDDGRRVFGMADLETGVKIRLFDEQQVGVDVAMIPMLSFPTGTERVSTGAVDFTLKLTWARELPAGFGLSGNYNVAYLKDDRRLTQQALSVSLGHDLFAGWGGYIEAYGFMPMARGIGAGWTIDGGVSRMIGENFQFDIEGGRGITDEAPDWFVGFGFAIRGRVRDH